MQRKIAVLITLLFAVSIPTFAQKNEVSVSAGVVATSDQTTTLVGVTCPVLFPTCAGPFKESTRTSVALEGAYTRQIFKFGSGVSLGLELPLVGVPSRDVRTRILGVPSNISSVSSLFFTPSARIKFLESHPVSPFFSVGGGLAHYGIDGSLGSRTRGAFQFGGGLDFKTPLPHIGIRAEVRDFWARSTGESGGIVQVSPERQHNIFAGGGVVFKF
jgi:hypothetical protein